MSDEIAEKPVAPAAGSPVDTTRKPGADLLQKVEDALGKIVTLRVTTAIATISGGTIVENQDGLTVSYTADAKDAASTVIDLALGNLTASRSGMFATDPNYGKLHDDNVQLARDVRKETFDLVTKAVEAVLALRKL